MQLAAAAAPSGHGGGLSGPASRPVRSLYSEPGSFNVQPPREAAGAQQQFGKRAQLCFMYVSSCFRSSCSLMLVQLHTPRVHSLQKGGSWRATHLISGEASMHGLRTLWYVACRPKPDQLAVAIWRKLSGVPQQAGLSAAQHPACFCFLIRQGEIHPPVGDS